MNMVSYVFLVVVVFMITAMAIAMTTWLSIESHAAENWRAGVEKRFGDFRLEENFKFFRKSSITYVLTVCHWCMSTWLSLPASAYILAGSVWLLDLDWRIALMSWLPGSLALAYTAARIRDSEAS